MCPKCKSERFEQIGDAEDIRLCENGDVYYIDNGTLVLVDDNE